jgi:5'-nucleotidase
MVFLVIIALYVSILLLHPFIKNIKNMIVREMSEQNGNLGLNQNYERVSPYDKNYTYIPIVGTDDIHGYFFPQINSIRIEGETLKYKTGGLEYIAKYINILREEFGPHRVLYFDGGDFYQGGIDSVLFDGEIMQDFFNLVGLNGSTVGNHEFDYSREWIEKKIKNAKYKTLINNIMDSSNSKRSGALGDNQESSSLYEIKLENGDIIKIGVIGLSFNMKNDKKMPNTWGNRDTWDNITFF